MVLSLAACVPPSRESGAPPRTAEPSEGPRDGDAQVANGAPGDRVQARVTALRDEYGKKGFHVVAAHPWVVIGDEAPEMVERRAEGTVAWATERLQAAYFDKDPSELVEVWLFADSKSYYRHAKTIFGDEPDTPFGYYTYEHEALIMNIASGGGTLVHEMVHPLMRSNFPTCPSWFNEGLAEFAAEHWSTEADMFIREAVLTDNLPPIAQLNGRFAYHGGHSVWDYVATQYGREKVGEIVRRYRVTRSVDLAFRVATGLPLDEISRRWRTALQEIYFPEVAARERLEHIGRPLASSRPGTYYANPVVSPRGDRVAFLSTRSGLFDLYIQRINTNERTRLIRGQLNSSFESLPILTVGLSWSPDGRQVAVATKSGRDEAIVIVDVFSSKRRSHRLKAVEQIVSIDWGPDGKQIAVSAVARAQSDLFLLDIESGDLRQLTADEHSDLAPAFSPDGRSLVFHSDRASIPGLFEGAADQLQMDLFALDVDSGDITRLTDTPGYSEHSARYAPGGQTVTYLSDRNGITNLYALDLEQGRAVPLTNLLVGIRQYSLAADGSRAAVLSYYRGTPTIYVVNYPLQRRLNEVELVPNVWAQRRDRRPMISAPSVLLASEPVRNSNPFLRDASDATGMPVADNSDLMNTTPDSSSGALNVEFRDTPLERVGQSALPPPGRPVGIVEAGETRPYRLRFSPDIVYGSASYDVLYGVQGVTQMTFSDMLGDHRLSLSTNLLIDLRNSDYIASYENRRRRVDWQLSAFQTSRLVRQSVDGFRRYFRFRRYGVSSGFSLPFNKFHRLDIDLTAVRVSRADVTDSRAATKRRSMVYPSLTLTRDVTAPGFLAPSSGSRMALGVAGTPIAFEGGAVRFVTLLVDMRRYVALSDRFTLAVRGAAGASLGPERQSFYASGVQNWINRSFDDLNGFPVNDVSEFLFAAPVMPLRGFNINESNGTRFGLANMELRFPLDGRFAASPLRPLRVMHGAAFVDIGGLASSAADSTTFRVFRRDEEGRRRLEDVRMGTGFGLRSVFFGYPVRLDLAWPFDGRKFGRRQWYFSVGFDF